jgi:hypothetical protein
LALAATTAFTAAVASGLLAALASGSFGPGRFVEVGVNPWIFGLVIFVEVLIPSFLAALLIIKPFDDQAAGRK